MDKFTDLQIKNLEPRAERYEVREKDGFVVRVTPKGEKTFAYIFQLDGTKRRMTLGPYPQLSLKEARAKHLDARRMVKRGIDPIEQQREEAEAARKAKEDQARLLTVERLAEEYIERHAKPNKRTWEQDQYLLTKDVFPLLGHRKAEEVDRRDINRLLDRIVDRGAPILAGRVLAVVSKMFNFGIQRGELNANPCAGVAKPPAGTPRERVLTEAEVAALWAATGDGGGFAATPPVALAVRLLLATGLRVSEASKGRWDEIDLDARWWEIPAERMKNKRPHRVWLAGQALATLQRLRELSGGSTWVFVGGSGEEPIGKTAVQHAISRNLKPLGFARFSPHDLRRTVATRLGELGILPHIVGKVLSHVDRSVTGMHYDKGSYDSDKRRALEAWDRRLSEIIGERQPGATVLQLPQRAAAL